VVEIGEKSGGARRMLTDVQIVDVTIPVAAHLGA
jgi:hypothetical protein